MIGKFKKDTKWVIEYPINYHFLKTFEIIPEQIKTIHTIIFDGIFLDNVDVEFNIVELYYNKDNNRVSILHERGDYAKQYAQIMNIKDYDEIFSLYNRIQPMPTTDDYCFTRKDMMHFGGWIMEECMDLGQFEFIDDVFEAYLEYKKDE